MRALIEAKLRESDDTHDRSTHENVVEYAVRFLFKNKSPAAAAKATVRKLSGHENLFLGPGISIIDAKSLEAAIWNRMVEVAIRGIRNSRPGGEHLVIDGTLFQFRQKKINKPASKAVREKFKNMIIKKLGRDPFVNDGVEYPFANDGG